MERKDIKVGKAYLMLMGTGYHIFAPIMQREIDNCDNVVLSFYVREATEQESKAYFSLNTEKAVHFDRIHEIMAKFHQDPAAKESVQDLTPTKENTSHANPLSKNACTIGNTCTSKHLKESDCYFREYSYPLTSCIYCVHGKCTKEDAVQAARKGITKSLCENEALATDQQQLADKIKEIKELNATISELVAKNLELIQELEQSHTFGEELTHKNVNLMQKVTMLQGVIGFMWSKVKDK